MRAMKTMRPTMLMMAMVMAMMTVVDVDVRPLGRHLGILGSCCQEWLSRWSAF